MIKKLTLLAISIFVIYPNMLVYAQENKFNNPDVEQYIATVSEEHGISQTKLRQYFSQTEFIENSIRLMDRPAESLGWKTYLERILSDDRVRRGAVYYRKYKREMAEATKKYGVPAHVITGVIGIETTYGKAPLRYRAFDVISTLAFHYPRRAKYFKYELTELLRFSERMNTDPFTYKSSYAGAIGIPQFMPSSVNSYAVSSENTDSDVDLVNSHEDAIHSVANYLSEHGWKKNEPALVKVRIKGSQARKIVTDSPCKTTKRTVTQLKKLGVIFPSSVDIPTSARGTLTILDDDYYVTFSNFCTIFRYNPSSKYSMAVIKLGLYVIGEEKKLKTR